ncbi:Cilia- and flagella-associated 58 [Brachionus plicatilis]|uniref:Cilia-and flagella-associated 58 n=1 Tax=Brachionus plicatilis TaxID=10195 RepID=A0A3M7RSL2_BRAPC|nr:Cilia- and flagella-associated 58 [Brachionus plicatilis]
MSEEKKEDTRPKIAFDDTSFQQLEQEFQDVLQELTGDKSLEKFRAEYEKLHKALLKSHESEKRLMIKCRELNADLVANAAKVQTALKLGQEDQNTIATLRKELEKVWKISDSYAEKEQSAKETIQSLKQEIANLTKLVEQGAGLTVGQEQNVNELMKNRDELVTERDKLLDELVKLRSNLEDTQTKNLDLERKFEEANQNISQLESDINTRKMEAQRELRKRDKIERDLKEARSTLEQKQNDLKNLQQTVEKSKADILKLETQQKEQKAFLDRTLKDSDVLNARFVKLQHDFEAQVLNNEALANENALKVHELKSREDEVNVLKTDAAKINRLKENTQKKLKILEDQKSEAENEKELLRNTILTLEKEIELAKKDQEKDKKAIEELTRERDQLNKNLSNAAKNTEKQVNLIKTHDSTIKHLEQEIANYKEEATKQRKLIFQLEKERDRYISEASELTQRVLQHMEDIKIKEMQIFDFKKKIAEQETKYKQQQNLYEAVRSDRNLYSKNLIERQDEINENRRKLKIMTHQIDQLKEEIQNKEQALVKEHAELQQVQKEREHLRAELGRMKAESQETKGFLEAQQAEERKLLKIIQEADSERLRQKKQLEQVIQERDILGTQLVRRNDELALLYEKIKIQQSTLNKGEIQYKARIEDLRILKLEIKRLRREKKILSVKVANVDDLSKEIYHVQRELLRERTRCRALEEELENPMNVHRWRKLEGSDPSTFELIQKIQALQKRLIAKTEEVVQKELLIQEKEKLYTELKHILARQPGPEVAEQLSIYQQTLKQKTKQMKSLASELNMYESQISEYKFEIDKMNKELSEVKNKYFLQKKKEHLFKERDRLEAAGAPGGPITAPGIAPNRNANENVKFIGGGFSLKAPVAKANA